MIITCAALQCGRFVNGLLMLGHGKTSLQFEIIFCIRLLLLCWLLLLFFLSVLAVNSLYLELMISSGLEARW